MYKYQVILYAATSAAGQPVLVSTVVEAQDHGLAQIAANAKVRARGLLPRAVDRVWVLGRGDKARPASKVPGVQDLDAGSASKAQGVARASLFD